MRKDNIKLDVVDVAVQIAGVLIVCWIAYLIPKMIKETIAIFKNPP